MSIAGTDLSGHPITFCIQECDGQPTDWLTIDPATFLNYGDTRWRADYVRVEIWLHVLGTQLIQPEYLTVGSLLDLYELLHGYQSGRKGADTIETVDGQFSLTVEWREATRDVRFAGRFPAFDERVVMADRLKSRNAVYRVLSFEFALDPGDLRQPVLQIQNLLELLRALKPHRTVEAD